MAPGFVQTISAGKRGGIQQVSAGYASGFPEIGRPILTIASLPADLSPDYAYPMSELVADPTIASPWKWLDLAAAARWRRSEAFRTAAGFIAHNGHSIDFLRRCKPKAAPIISVCHMEKLGRRLAADVILCLTEVQKVQALRELGAKARGKTVAAVGNPLALAPVADAEALASHRLRSKRIVVGTLCNLEDRKALDVLLKAVAQLRGRGLNVAVRFGGVGSLREMLGGLAQELGLADHVEFVGHVEDRDAYFRTLDIFCLPSRIEPFGLALIEAMSRALPVVASDTEGPVEILNTEAVGLTFRTDEAQDLARQLERLISEPDQARSMALAAERRAIGEYSAPAVARKIVRVVEEHAAATRSA